MLGLSIALTLGISTVLKLQPFPLQFVRSGYTQTVVISVDGMVKATSAGKMIIRDRSGRLIGSFCANVRGPVSPGQVFMVRPAPTRAFGGTVRLAGNVVAKAFSHAQSAAQCAGLQLAVWEAIEDGGMQADFNSGSFQARAGQEALHWARTYYQAIEQDGDAVFLQQGNDGQSQIFV